MRSELNHSLMEEALFQHMQRAFGSYVVRGGRMCGFALAKI